MDINDSLLIFYIGTFNENDLDMQRKSALESFRIDPLHGASRRDAVIRATRRRSVSGASGRLGPMIQAEVTAAREPVPGPRHGKQRALSLAGMR